MKPSTAHRIVNDPEFQGLVTDIRQSVFEDFSKTPPNDSEALVRLRLKLDCLDELKGKMTSLARDFARSQK